MTEGLARRACITGAAQSQVGRRLGRDPLELTLDACIAAIEDAGLSRQDIDGLATYPGNVGTPKGFSGAGISEVHDNFKPDYDKRDAFPSDKVAGDWVNVYDRLDPVAFDARISNDYQKGGDKVVIDERVHNSGKWRHSSYKYYGQQALCDHLKKLLAL